MREMGPVPYHRKVPHYSRPGARRPMRIVALLLCLCSIDAVAQGPVARLERGNGPEPATLDAHRCQEVACGNILRLSLIHI